MSNLLLVILVVVASGVLSSKAFYTLEIPESSSQKESIKQSITDTVDNIKWMENQLLKNQILMKDEDEYKSYETSVASLFNILQNHKIFFEQILQTNPKDSKQALPDIQKFLLKLEDTEETDTMIENFSNDFSEVSFKLGLMLEELHLTTRRVLQSLSAVILLSSPKNQSNLTENRESTAKKGEMLPREAESSLAENCSNLQNITSQLKFVFNGTIIKIIFAVKKISDLTYFRVDFNKTLATPKSLRKLINFEGSCTRSMIEDRWGNFLKELKDKFGVVSENATSNIFKFHNAYLREVNSSQTFMLDAVDSVVNKFSNLFGLLMENIDLETLQIRSMLLEKSLLSEDPKKLFESYKDQLILKAGLIRDVTKKLIGLVNENVDIEKDPFGNISNRYVQTFSYQIARITFRTRNGNILQDNYEKFLKKNGLSLRKNLQEPSKIFKAGLTKKFEDLLAELTTQGYKIINIGISITDFVKEIEVK